jgi:tetratricopeptide (TPR) repeat protein
MKYSERQCLRIFSCFERNVNTPLVKHLNYTSMFVLRNQQIQKLLIIVMLIMFSPVMSQNFSIAKDFYEHNLKERALEEFIHVYNNPIEKQDVRVEALYFMGQISFDDGRYSTALNDWKRLINQYPTSTRAIEIKERLTQLKDVFSESVDEHISSSIAKSYIDNGDFWSDDRRKFSIDASWLPKLELALDWYDKTISEFPNSYVAELAYQRKLFAILGWKESGQYGSKYGIEADYNKYLPLLLKTFNEFEVSYPENSFLQAYRYQIAQVYWDNKDWENTRVWLTKIIDQSKGGKSFYTETAKARLNKLEY